MHGKKKYTLENPTFSYVPLEYIFSTAHVSFGGQKNCLVVMMNMKISLVCIFIIGNEESASIDMSQDDITTVIVPPANTADNQLGM